MLHAPPKVALEIARALLARPEIERNVLKPVIFLLDEVPIVTREKEGVAWPERCTKPVSPRDRWPTLHCPRMRDVDHCKVVLWMTHREGQQMETLRRREKAHVLTPADLAENVV